MVKPATVVIQYLIDRKTETCLEEDMVALIVLNYNDYDTTSDFIEKIRGYSNIPKIIIVDNHSTDDSYERLSALASDKIDVVRTTANKGYASGNNFGIRYALEHYHPEYVIVSNPDVEFESAAVEKLYEQATQLENLGVIACRMNCLSGVALESAWKLPTYTDHLLGNFPILEKLFRFRTTYTEQELSDELVEVDAVSGAFFMISSAAYQAAGGFDEDTFLYCEETIMSERLHEKGYKNYLLTTEKYLHKHSVSINKSISSLKKKLYIRQQSKVVHCVKYLHTGKWKICLLWITFYMGLYERIILSNVKIFLRKCFRR